MSKKLKKIIIPLILVMMLGNCSFAIVEGIVIDDNTFSFVNKAQIISSSFNDNYEIVDDYTEENYELKQSIVELTKKTTYLLLGGADENNESSENYYKRHQDYLNLRYDPEVPKDESSTSGLDENSQEYKDDILSGISVPGMFLMLEELEVNYNTYGEIRVSIINDELIISTMTLPNVTMKEQSATDSTKYDVVQANLTMYYYFKKINNEYKLLYLYGETDDEIVEYMENNEEKSGELSQNEDYVSQLKDLYDFSKAEAVTDKTLAKIYENNKSSIVFLRATYNIGTVTSANGFFINDGLIVTTYNFIEDSLMKAQDIIISNSEGNVFDLDGIVTVNMDKDVAVLKVKDKNQNHIMINDINAVHKEDAIIALNSATGVGLKTSKGIITAIDRYIQTSLPETEEMQGGPLFNANGELVGMMNSMMFDSSISYATSVDVIKKYYDKFSNIELEDIEAISFDSLKENYYIRYNDESIVNNVPEKKWEEYAVDSVNDMIAIELIKSTYKDGILSLRYKNDIPEYIDTMQFAAVYIDELKGQGYTEKIVSDSKAIYENKDYQIIVMTEFDYLIIVMVRL